MSTIKPPDNKEILVVSGLCVSYGERFVIKDFSFVLNRGEKLIIAGPNGCGKTTLLKCVLGTNKNYSGKIQTYTDNIAYCKQDYPNSAFPISVREVVEMGLYRNKCGSKTDVLEAMKLTGTDKLAERSFYSLSGGERQRVSLARCFCQKADLLLFDEPSSFLDSLSLKTFADTLKQLPSYISALVVTHDKNLSEMLGWRTAQMKDNVI